MILNFLLKSVKNKIKTHYQVILKVSAIGSVKIFVRKMSFDSGERLAGDDAVEVAASVPTQLRLKKF